MKALKYLFLCFVFSLTNATLVHASEEAVNTITAPIPKPSVNYVLSYGFYKYDLKGTNSANTSIYKFGRSTVDLHLVTATWLVSPVWTFVGFIPYMKTMVETVYEPTAVGANFQTEDKTEGLADVRLMAVRAFVASEHHLGLYDLSVTLPTGGIDNYFTSVPSQRAAYNMQLGSGTPDAIVGLTYSYTLSQWVNALRGQGTVRGGQNTNGWALGNEFLATASTKYKITPFFEAGVAANYKARGAVQGRDDLYEKHNSYGSATDPGFDPNIKGDGHQYYHAPQINWDAELVAKVQAPVATALTASLEVGVPFWNGAINKDDVRLDVQNWVAASVSGVF